MKNQSKLIRAKGFVTRSCYAEDNQDGYDNNADGGNTPPPF